jgi:CheY-like chemotaxis protein
MIVEDNALLAMLLEDMLGELGVSVAGSAGSLAEAVSLAGEVSADVAVLDLNLDGELSFPAAERLMERGIPVIFATGYGAERMPERFAKAPTIEKPFAPQELEQALLRALSAR